MRLRTPTRALGDGPLIRRRSALIVAAAGLGLSLAACGRSAPEGATTDAASGVEPATAGVQVVSAAPVVDPAVTVPTTVTTETVPSSMVQTASTYVVEAGDTLSVIAEQFQVTVAALSEANNITDVDAIKPGQELIIPAG